ncbi:MAG: hypothetical protein WDA75_22200, partial [Candidatus Latescibacterota bacterium]
MTVRIRVSCRQIGMGRTVGLTAVATQADGRPAAGFLLLPYVNGRRWGSHELAGADGRAIWRLPLPRPGIAEIQVEARPPAEAPSQAGTPPPAELTGGLITRLPHLLTGYLLPDSARVSRPQRVQVQRRVLSAIRRDPDHLVGAQWCPLFTPAWFNWDTAQAVPLVGFYRTWDTEVIRQHVIWLAESGIDFLVVDWVNQLWDKEGWEERSDAAVEVIHATTVLLEILAEMREEGIAVPRVLLMLGLENGPRTTVRAVNGEIEWIRASYLRNPRFAGLLQEYLGKPLLLVFRGSGPLPAGDPDLPSSDEPIDCREFTIRWISAQHQVTRHHEAGAWTWMDGALDQGVTWHQGEPEAMTASVAFFDGSGWRGETAHGRRGGWTYLESFRRVLAHRPRLVQLHQFQEFTGQPETPGGWYGDSYSPELSDDIEPTSLTAPAYRGDGGWGFRYLNLTRALVDLYRGETPQTTVVAINAPLPGQVVTGSRLEVAWAWVGARPGGFRLELNGRTVARGLQENSATLDLSAIGRGPARLRLTAEGTVSRYALSDTEDALPDLRLPPAQAEVLLV